MPRNLPAESAVVVAIDLPAAATTPRRTRFGWVLGLVGALASGHAIAVGDPARGQYLTIAGGCVACHTEDRKDAAIFAGGRALKTAFGTFYGPNLTPHPEAGIGRWTEADFVRAMRQGLRPDGAHFYPAFPYPSFTKIRDDDLADLWAYLRTLPPSARPNQAHELKWPFRWRTLIAAWNWLFFTPGPMANDPLRPPAVDRGAYLVQALGHCGECHTPRNLLGASKKDRALAGGKGPTGKDIPNLTPTRLGKWSDADLREFFLSGITPDFDSADEMMAEVVRNTTSRLTPADLTALMAYLRALPPQPEEPRSARGRS